MTRNTPLRPLIEQAGLPKKPDPINLRGVMVKVMDYGMVESEFKLSHAITLTFGQIPFGKHETLYPLCYGFK